MSPLQTIADDLTNATRKLAAVWRNEVDSFSSLEEAKLGRTVIEPISVATKQVIDSTNDLEATLRCLEEKGIV